MDKILWKLKEYIAEHLNKQIIDNESSKSFSVCFQVM